MMHKTSLAVSQQPQYAPRVRSFIPQTQTEAIELAKVLASGGLVGRGMKPETIFTVILLGAELGITPLAALRNINVIDGKPALSADCMAALCMRSAQCKYFVLVSSDDKRAIYETLRLGYQKPVRLEFTFEQATRAGVTGKDNWRKYPAAMLRARCITAIARTVYPDIVSGLYNPEELGADGMEGMDAPIEEYDSGPRMVETLTDSDEVDAFEPDAPAMFTALSRQLEQADTLATLNQVARATMSAHTSGELDNGYFETLKKAVEKKRAELRGHVASNR